MKISSKQLLALVAGMVLMVGGSQVFGQGGIALDFSTDPEDRGVEFFGDSEWRQTGGVENSGFLSVTDAINGQSGAIVFPDLADGEALTSFRISADLRVGDGSDRPADGFSFNLVTPDDPLLEGNLIYSGIGTEGSLPEEGSTTGLGIGFDEWQSGPTDPNAGSEDLPLPGDPAALEVGGDQTCPNTRDDFGEIVNDCVGLSIRVDGELIGQAGFPTLNGDLFDNTSLQTGPQGEELGFARLVIELVAQEDGTSNLFVSYKDRTVFDQAIEYTPSPGQFVFGGRTGGANSNHHIDNISLVTDFVGITLGDFDMDDDIDLDDYGILLSNMDQFGQDINFSAGDIDFSGSVDLADFADFRRIFLQENGMALSEALAAESVPEPSSLLMLLFGLVGLQLRRRR